MSVSVDGPTYVDLDTTSVVTEDADWDLLFEGVSIFTNGGASGPGEGKAFGPLDEASFDENAVPAEVPFLFEDEPGGAFIDWYVYDQMAHVLYSRYHVFGVRRGDALFKVQILSYYGEAEGAPVSALYQVRSARVGVDGPEDTTDWVDLDATAGGSSPAEDAPSGCVVLSTGETLLLSPAEAATRSDWDLCFRRDAVTVNGGASGPGSVEAVDLDAKKTTMESLEIVVERTAASELESFEAVDDATLEAASLDWRLDGVASAFTDEWLTTNGTLSPANATWLVAAADGETPFFVVFDSLDGATSSTFNVVNLRIKPLGGTLP